MVHLSQRNRATFEWNTEGSVVEIRMIFNILCIAYSTASEPSKFMSCGKNFDNPRKEGTSGKQYKYFGRINCLGLRNSTAVTSIPHIFFQKTQVAQQFFPLHPRLAQGLQACGPQLHRSSPLPGDGIQLIFHNLNEETNCPLFVYHTCFIHRIVEACPHNPIYVHMSVEWDTHTHIYIYWLIDKYSAKHVHLIMPHPLLCLDKLADPQRAGHCPAGVHSKTW